MKKVIMILVMGLLLASCGSTLPSQKQIATNSASHFEGLARAYGYIYTAQAHSSQSITTNGLSDRIDRIGVGVGASKISQQQANEIALKQCTGGGGGYSCIISKTGNTITLAAQSIINEKKEKKIAEDKKEEERRIAEEKRRKEEKRKKFAKLEARYGSRCEEDGFIKGTVKYKDCINEKETVRVAEEKRQKAAEERRRKDKKKKLAEDQIREEKQLKITTMINDAKNTCKELGYKEETEKFADCSLELYTQRIEIAAEKNQKIIVEHNVEHTGSVSSELSGSVLSTTRSQSSTSGSNVITIYDPVRDSRQLIRQGQRMLSGACTLGINC